MTWRLRRPVWRPAPRPGPKRAGSFLSSRRASLMFLSAAAAASANALRSFSLSMPSSHFVAGLVVGTAKYSWPSRFGRRLVQWRPGLLDRVLDFAGILVDCLTAGRHVRP